MNQSEYRTRGGTHRFLTRFLGPVILIAVFMMGTAAFAAGDLPPALSSGDLQKVMKWIAQEVSSYRQPFCYRDSYGRGVGKPMHCAEGQQYDAGLCYTPCKSDYKGVGPVCWGKCKEGYHDDGATCRRNAHIFGKDSYGRGAGYALWSKGKCEKKHGSCEKYGALYYPKCKSGYDNVGCCICRQKHCPSGYHDDGATCRKDVHIYGKSSYGRGVGKPVSTCPADEEKDAALCYKKCRGGFHGVGPVCWQNCPSGRKDCGVGCTTSTKACVSNTASMVTSPLILAVNIATMGSGSAATSTGKFAAISQKMKQLAASTKNMREIAKMAKQVGTVAYEVNQTTEMWVTDYVGNFEQMTDRRVVNELSKHFSGSKLLWVKQQYAKNHLALMLKSDGIETAQNMLSVVSAFDPSGVTGVIDAFAKPVCSFDKPFPSITVLSQSASSTAAPPPAPAAPASTAGGGPLKWAAGTGAIPPNAVMGGQERGRALPVCRGAYQGGVHPGKLVAGKCNIGWGGREITLGSFEVLTGNNARLAWVRGPGAAGMVMGGQERGTALPVCRGAYQGGVHPGKLVAGKCNIGWGGREITLGSFEVLIQR